MNERYPRRDDNRGNDRNDRSGGRDRRDDRSNRGGQNRSRGESADRPRRDGDRNQGDSRYSDRPRRDGNRQYGDRPRRDGDRSHGDRPRQDGDRSYSDRPRHDGDRSYGDRPRRDGERNFSDRPRRNGDRNQGDRQYGDSPRRDGDRSYGDRPRRDGERNFSDRPRRDENRSYGDRNYGDRPRRDSRDDRGGQKSYGRGGSRGGGRSDRGGSDREFTEAERLQHELRPVRADHSDPEVPDEVQAKDLPASARNELKTLQAETQEWVARHLVMVSELIDDDPELAHQHAISATRRAGRIPVAREALAATAYRTGDFALALRELRTQRRLSGTQGNIALIVEAERALGRSQKAIESGLEANISKLNATQRAQLAIAMSGARLDLGQTRQALYELEIPELNPKRAFTYSPELFAAYAAVLEDLGRDADAKVWRSRAERAEAALNAELAAGDELVVFEIYEHEPIESADSFDAETHSDPYLDNDTTNDNVSTNTSESETDTVSNTEAAPADATQTEPGATEATPNGSEKDAE